MPLLLPSCSDERVVEAPVSRVDSAGVQIVYSDAPAWPRDGAWALSDTPVIVIDPADGAGDLVPLDPASVFTDRNGALIIADGLSAGHNAIFVFDSAGRYVRRIGREGQGPCEFQQLWWAQPFPGDSIAAYDEALSVVHILSADGGCGRSVRIPPGQLPPPPGTYTFSPGAGGAFSDGSLLMYQGGAVDLASGGDAPWYRHTLVRVSAESEVKSLGVFPIMQVVWENGRQQQRPFTPFASVAMDDMDFIHASGETFELRRFSADGRLKQILRRRHSVRSVTPEVRSAYIDAMHDRILHTAFEGGAEAAARSRTRLEETRWPEAQPAIGHVVVDDRGHIWVSEYNQPLLAGTPEERSAVAWSVFSPDGHWLGDVPIPGRFRIMSIEGDRVYGVWTGDDDVRSIRVYRVVGRPS